MAFQVFGGKRAKEEQARAAAAQSALQCRLSERLKGVERTRQTQSSGDNRGDRRETVYRVGSAIVEPGRELTCRIVNQSFSGMRLELADAAECPEEFALTIPTLRFIGIVRKAWQNDAQVGVAILRWNEAA
jgi:hypothetical protein